MWWPFGGDAHIRYIYVKKRVIWLFGGSALQMVEHETKIQFKWKQSCSYVVADGGGGYFLFQQENLTFLVEQEEMGY